MSSDEQSREIGRLVLERAALKQESALVLRKIQDAGKALGLAGAQLMRNCPTADDLSEGLLLLDGVLRFGDIRALRESVAHYQALQERIATLAETLRAAGVD